MIIAWDAKNKDDLTPTKEPYKFVWEYGGVNLTVFLIKDFTNIDIRSKKT